ncbi:sulfite exporter TauE/SafE family protein [Andreprevotia chitinilytica]|uniref:sulfite exporter TauE/SafE family protein n=1 Tax=Andreprevotia chitinilytica TaxID=396808 RepID=UPI00068948A5|nr:sulfite exporter TauE/SafE family protein [Andreprevotia chitinilytica]
MEGLSALLAHINGIYVLSGLAVGFIVGMTGVGGGSLMTPVLLFFGINPATAVGTDLLYASITKASGVFVHQKHKNIDWSVTGWLALGSVPAAALTVLALHVWQGDTATINKLIKHSLGIALVLTSVAIICKGWLLAFAQRHARDWLNMSPRTLASWTVVIGFCLGVIVTLSSIGAGALGTVALFLIYPLLPTSRLVGTEIAHAVPLTLVAGLGHAGLGNIDWFLLGNLLCGSLPGIYVGSHLSGRMPEKVLRPLLALMLLIVGSKLVF